MQLASPRLRQGAVGSRRPERCFAAERAAFAAPCHKKEPTPIARPTPSLKHPSHPSNHNPSIHTVASAAPRLATRRGAASIQRAPGAAAAAAAAAGRAARIAATLVPRSASTAVKDPVTDAAPAKAAEPKFDWAKAWYPAAAEEHLDPAKPHRVRFGWVGGVLWRMHGYP
jgi:hypothetical protein